MAAFISFVNFYMQANLKKIRQAAQEIVECQRILANTGHTVITELLRFSDDFFEWDPHPNDNVMDYNTGAQYYYHAHPKSKRGFKEHGHFHTFMKNEKPVDSETLPLTHIVAISMNAYGIPQGLFTVNHWVTDGIWEDAPTVESFLGNFLIDHAQPSWVVNRWINSMLRLYEPEIINLLKERDHIINTHIPKKKNIDILALFTDWATDRKNHLIL
ncbi:MAG: hypothetical protein B7Y25_08535 [Alphaproteobacteria bacterium 16-39-46]|nr:MAG: hypothetical protein B7Y25_08535 [Alphaproteobacteria bacterium 16-39-46]OZA40997.1 MAG: hypothetical protein B7X84_08720 [Alphaproteobacteria bacterium 17-39-52]HQS84992.1 hypothetical protein [Alphaproteobacteria bacterium]HQS94734.1 hypothetical protein [Alphaproteobacteria bacterium]